MTGKVRVQRALNRNPLDRCPRDADFTAEAAERVERFIGVSSREEVLQALGIDVRHVYPVYSGRLQAPQGDVHFDEWGIGRKQVGYQGSGFDGAYDEIVIHPLAESSLDGVLAYPWPRPEHYEYQAAAAEIRSVSSQYWVSSGAYSIFERGWNLMGMERFLTDLACSPEVPLAVLDTVCEFYTDQTLRVLGACGGAIDQIETYDDVGTQRGMLISPTTWRNYIKPLQARFNARIKQQFPVKIMYHSCGSITPIIEDLIEIGVDILDPIQTRAAGMVPVWLKEHFGGRLCFHGGVDTQQTLPHATPAEVKAEADYLQRVLGWDGGYVLAPSHAIQADVPPGNVLAMFANEGARKEEQFDAQ